MSGNTTHKNGYREVVSAFQPGLPERLTLKDQTSKSLDLAPMLVQTPKIVGRGREGVSQAPFFTMVTESVAKVKGRLRHYESFLFVQK